MIYRSTATQTYQRTIANLGSELQYIKVDNVRYEANKQTIAREQTQHTIRGQTCTFASNGKRTSTRRTDAGPQP